jgi:drug/metabolite transporter (DMT)-like permease
MLVISNGHLSLLTNGVGIGELTLLGCVLCWSLYSVIGRRAMRGMSALTTVTYSAIAGTLFLAPVALAQGVLGSIPSYGPEAWASILFLALFGTVVGFLWYYQAIKEIGAVRSGVFINFVPLFAMLFGLLLLGEPMTPTLLQGAALVITGAWITNNSRFHRVTVAS